jgi:hypothetical protein
MANLKGSENPVPHVLLEEVATDGSATGTPAADFRHLFLGEDGALHLKDSAAAVTDVGGAGAVAAEDVTITDSGTYYTGTDVEAALQEIGADIAGLGTGYTLPVVTNSNGNYAASGTSVVVTMTAPTAGDNLVALVYSTGRGCNSITQTNVTWTQRFAGNGSSQYFEVWTGVVAASAGTTATFAFTGSNKQYAETFVWPGAGNFTSATIVGSANTGTGTTHKLSVVPGAAGDNLIIGTSANSPTDSYSSLSIPFNVTSASALGGAGRCMLTRAQQAAGLLAWTTSSGSVAGYMAVVKVS